MSVCPTWITAFSANLLIDLNCSTDRLYRRLMLNSVSPAATVWVLAVAAFFTGVELTEATGAAGR